MKITVLSGKGGAGKTLVSVNLAAAARNAVYVDCDVEEPNGRLFWRPESVSQTQVCTLLPSFDLDKCTRCRKCVDFCRFNALVCVRDRMKVFDEVCHSCGGCVLVCPEQAIRETKKEIGHVEEGRHGSVRVITGVLNTGEASGVPVIRAALDAVPADSETVIIDGPPGSACSVMESTAKTDYCVLVAEPTAFGFHNFQMVYELATLLGKPCGVVINKMDDPYEPLETFCREHSLPVLARLPYEAELAARAARGEILCETMPSMAREFSAILQKIGGAVQ